MKTSFSLILGGGAARWLAHIGVIQRLEELSMRPSEIVGTSIGALVWAFYSLGYTSKEMRDIAKDIPYLSLIDIDIRTGTIKWMKLMRYLSKYFSEKTFADTLIPLVIVATDIDSWEKYVFREGKIIDAIRASISIPGIFMPYKYADHTFVDGGLTSNLPIEEAREKNEIIAVSVQMDVTKVKRLSKRLIFPGGTPVSHAYGMIRKTLAIMMAQNEKSSLATRSDALLIRPEREDIEYYDFKKVDLMIQAGYEAAKSSIS